MATKPFSAPDSSTIWDVALNTYGDCDNMVKLMMDNGHKNINTYPQTNQVYLFDDTLVENQNILQSNLSVKKFATRQRQSTNEANMKYYEQNDSDTYVAAVDGETIAVFPDQIGVRVFAVEREIKPLDKSSWSWNPATGVLSLLNGVTLDAGMQVEILFARTIQS